jgi:hypothetical protein
MLLHEKYAQVTQIEELLPLSLRILRFKMTALYRKSARRGEYGSVSVDEVQVPDLAPDPATFVERKETLERLRQAMYGPVVRALPGAVSAEARGEEFFGNSKTDGSGLDQYDLHVGLAMP